MDRNAAADRNAARFAATLHNGRDRNTWPEQLHRYVEHYFWVPQNLIKTEKAARAARRRGEKKIEAFYGLIRSQEVPLNFCLNLVLRVVPPNVRIAFLRQFHVDHAPSDILDPQLLYGEDRRFTQPDLLLQTSTQRFFVELKVSSSAKVDQIEKYVRLHAHLDRLEGSREPYLYFLTPGPLERSWRPKSQRADLDRDGLQAFARKALKQQNPSLKQLTESIGPAPEVSYDSVIDTLRMGHATWQSIGDCLCSERDSRFAQGGEIADVMSALIGDFLTDLEARGLWNHT